MILWVEFCLKNYRKKTNFFGNTLHYIDQKESLFTLNGKGLICEDNHARKCVKCKSVFLCCILTAEIYAKKMNMSFFSGKPLARKDLNVLFVTLLKFSACAVSIFGVAFVFPEIGAEHSAPLFFLLHTFNTFDKLFILCDPFNLFFVDQNIELSKDFVINRVNIKQKNQFYWVNYDFLLTSNSEEEGQPEVIDWRILQDLNRIR